MLGLLCMRAGATSIVILRSSERIYIGADSRRMYRDPAATFNGTVCKIVPAGSFYFVASGLTYANDEQVADMGAAAGRSAPSVKGAAQLMRRRVQQFLPPALAAEKKIEHESLEHHSGEARRSLILETAFIGVRDGSALVLEDWYRREGNSGTARVKTESHTYSSSTPGRYDFIFLGKRRAIDDHLAGVKYPEIRGDADAVAFISEMINLEIAEAPDSTAGPIDILRLDGSGVKWLQRKAGCGGEGRQ